MEPDIVTLVLEAVSEDWDGTFTPVGSIAYDRATVRQSIKAILDDINNGRRVCLFTTHRIAPKE